MRCFLNGGSASRKLIIAVAVAASVSTTATATAATAVRPGVSVHIELPAELNTDPLAAKDQPFYNSCTLAFLYKATAPAGAGSTEKVEHYASTAGHCAFTDLTSTEQTHGPGEGPEIFLTAKSAGGAAKPGPRIGRVVYAAQTIPVLYPDPNLPEYMDIALIKLDPGVVTNPAMCHFGGPTGMREGALSSPEPLHLYGTGNTTGFHRETGTTLLPGRTGLGTSVMHPNVVTGTYPISGGDSGSPIIDAAGRAVALVTAPHYQPRVAVSLARAEHVLGLDFELRTAPLARGALPFGIDRGCAPVVGGG